MPFSMADVLWGGVVPAFVAGVLAVIWRRLDVLPTHQSLATVVPFVIAFLVGYWSLSLGKAVPKSHWEWLPWTLLLAATATCFADGDRPLRRLGVVTIVAAFTSWLLVPTWDHLDPSPVAQGTTLTVMVALVAVLLEPLVRRFPGVGILSLLAIVLTSGAVVLALAGSLRFAQVAGCGIAAMLGLTLSAWFGKRPNAAVGIALPFGLLVSSLMLIGRVNSFSDVPLASYLLIPLAPLTLWPAVRGPLSRATGLKRTMMLAAPIAVCLAAVTLAIFVSPVQF